MVAGADVPTLVSTVGPMDYPLMGYLGNTFECSCVVWWQGQIGGTFINAIDGHALTPGVSVSDGYSGG